MRHREFGRLLSQAVRCIAAREDKPIERVEQELGDLLGFSIHTVQRWRRGYVPDPNVVRRLAEVGVRRGNMPPGWLRRFLTQAQYHEADRVIEALAGQYGYICEFLDDRVIPGVEIFKRAQEYVLQAESRVWILNSHPREPTLQESLAEVQSGSLQERVLALEKLVSQHTYYERLIRRAVSKPGRFEYVRIVQVPVCGEEHPVISLETTGYHYLYHFYRMLKERKESKAPGREIKVLLYAGSLLRDTTFAVIDEHTLLLQITGLTWPSSGEPAYKLRGLLVIQSEARPNVVTQFADLFAYIRRGGREGKIENVTLADLDKFKDQIPPLEDEIVEPLDDLLEALWQAREFDSFIRVVQSVYGSDLHPLRQVLVNLLPKYQRHSQWSLVLNALGTVDRELREFLSPQPVEIAHRPPQVYALVIGVNTYQRLPRLALAAKDATDIRHELVASGYQPQNITLLLDNEATRANISNTLDQISRRARPEDLVFIFFSGHGAQRIGGFEPGEYLCPVEADWHNLRFTAISGEDFTKALNHIKARQMMICLDACHAGGIGQLKETDSEIRLALPADAYAHWSGEGRVILASSSPDEPSWELPPVGNGLLTHYLLKGIQKDVPLREKAVWALELANYVSQKVVEHGLQRPYLQLKGNDFPVMWPGRQTASHRKDAQI